MRHTMRKTRGFWSSAVMLGAVLIVLGSGGSGNVAMAAKPQPPRFVDNGDGTITDTQTGLMWETKTSGGGGPRDVNNRYTWSATEFSSDPDGTLFTDFLPQMNCEISADGSCPFDGKYRDWRIPTVAELRTILAACPSGGGPCIDPIFGPTVAFAYWTSSSQAGGPPFAWFVGFQGAFWNAASKSAPFYVRAVRAGS